MLRFSVVSASRAMMVRDWWGREKGDAAERTTCSDKHIRLTPPTGNNLPKTPNFPRGAHYGAGTQRAMISSSRPLRFH